MSDRATPTPDSLLESAVCTAQPRFQATRCAICDGVRVHYAFSIGHTRVVQCADCKFTARTKPGAACRTDGLAAAVALATRADGLASVIAQLMPEGPSSSPIRVAEWSEAGKVGLAPGDGVVLSVGQLDAHIDPLPSLKALRGLVRPGESVVFVASDVRSQDAEVGTPAWDRLVGERNAYLDTHAALTVLYRAGFRCRGIRRLRRRVTLEQLARDDAGVFACRRWQRHAMRLLPRRLRQALKVDARLADIAILATPRPTPEPLVSVVVPVYNEAATVGRVLDAVLGVRFEGARVEVIIVESHSTDGSRDIVQRYANRPGVTCLFEDRPRGKGHATRLGLAHARGDVLIIQDADLEYDIEDYHALIEPILRGHEAFVLGSRHGGRSHWKLRQFGKPLLSRLYNVAHVLVTAAINLLFGLNLRDPQTMYKVCRRDCIEGLSFHANFFDFDYELLLKIVRRGYRPVEVAVNYRSRSHAEGKKLVLWRDGPRGLLMIARLRFMRLKRFLHIGEPIE